MITAAGSGSGLDIESIVTQLMALEERPIQELELRRGDLDIQITDAGRLRSDIETLSTVAESLSDASKFGAWESTSSDEEVLTATNTDGLIAEAHSIEVQTLASAHRLISTPFDSPDADYGAGDFSFSTTEENFSITLASGQSTLVDLRDAINSAEENNIMIASLINTDAGTSLILTASETGTANTLTADTSASSRPAAFSEFNSATDAELTIDGLAVSSSSNKLTDTIPGLTLEVHSIGSAEVTSSQDLETITETLESFATSYNTLHDTLDRLSIGSFSGDGITRRIDSSLREVFFEPVVSTDGETTSLFDFGFTFDREGALSVDADVLENKALTNTLSLVNAFTQEDTGFADRMQALLGTYTETGGFFDGRTETIDAQQDTIDRQIERLEVRLESIEGRFRRQFTAMDITVTQLQSSSSFLFSSLGIT